MPESTFEFTDDLAGLTQQQQVAKIRAEALADGEPLDKPGVIEVLDIYRTWDELAAPGSDVQAYELPPPRHAALTDIRPHWPGVSDTQAIPRQIADRARELATARHAASQQGQVIALFPNATA